MGVDFVRGLAVGAVSTVAVVMLASITLLPALLGFAGRTIDRFACPARGSDASAASARLVPLEPRDPAPAVAGVRSVAPRRSCSCWRSRCSRCASAFADAGNNPTPTRPAAPTTSWPRLRRRLQRPAGARGRVPQRHRHRRSRRPAGRRAIARHRGRAVGDARRSSTPTATRRVIRSSRPRRRRTQRTTDLVHRLRDDVIPSARAGTGRRRCTSAAHRGRRRLLGHAGGAAAACSSARCSCRFLLLMVVFRSVLVPSRR